ncbi:MAG: glycosyltransferase family 39 protein [Nocardioidaceae bacterium]|nr:glycosyltransferase family 39 protein [Nocardioidaceae bacterium]
MHRRRETPPVAPARTLAGLGVVALVLGAWRLTTASSVGDETIYRDAATGMLTGDWSQNQQHPPLAKELIAVFRTVLTPLGVPDLAADRLLGVVCFVLTGLLVAVLGRRYAGAWAGVGAATLWWALPLAPGVLVQHVDRYALLEGPTILFGVAAVLASVRLLDHPSAGRWAVTGAMVGLATASKLTGVLSAVAVVTAAGVLLAARQRRRPLPVVGSLVLAGVVSAVVFAATYLPMGPTVARQALTTVVEFQLDHAADGHAMLVAGTVTASPPWWSSFYYQAAYLGWFGFAALWTLTLLGASRLVRRGDGVVLVATSTVMVLALVASSLKLPHYHAALVPFLCVMAAVGLASLLAVPRSVVRTGVAAVAVVLLAVPAVAGVVRTVGMQPQDYDAAAQALDDAGLASGPVVVWGDSRAARVALPQATVATTPEPACDVPALLTDDTIVPRLDVDLPAWRQRCGDAYRAYEFQRVTLWLRSD